MTTKLSLIKKFYSLLDTKPKAVVSLHFAASSYKMALFTRAGDSWAMTDYTTAQTSQPPKPADHADAIRAFLKRYQSFGNVGLILTWKAEFVEKPVVLPEMPPAEIEAAVRFAMEHHFSIQLDDCLFSAQPSVEIAMTQGVKTHQYFVYAAPKKDAKRYLDLMAALPVTPLAITPSSIAAAEILASPTAEKDQGILEMDSESATFQIFRKGKPLVSRSIAVGLKGFAPAIIKSYAADLGGEAQGMDPDVIQQVRPQIERLIAGLQSSVDFYHQQTFSGDIEKIYLVEDGSSLPDLPKVLEESIEIPVIRPESSILGSLAPTALAAEELKGGWIELLSAIGAFAVWKNRGMNLMPADILFRVESQARVKWLRFGAFAFGAICLLVLAYAFVAGGLKKQQLDALRVEEKSALDLQQLGQKSAVARGFGVFAGRGELSLPALLKFLSQATPDGVMIVDIAYDRATRKFELNGGAVASTGDPVGLSAELVKALASSPIFFKAELVEGARDPKSNAYRFKIEAVTHEFV